jgi:peptidoglycan/xylan/chitin deacetylase (PgdA/CDA1 family)
MNARLPVLLYHRVGQQLPSTHPELTICPQRFESQLRLLVRQSFTGISAAAWLAALKEGAPLPPRPILLTFDDGYRDLAEQAFPALERLGWRATVFVSSSTVGGRSDWDAADGADLPILSADDLRTWADRGIELGAHGSTHCDLTEVEPEQLRREVVGGRDELAELLGRPITAFAYPYGRYNDAVRDLVGAKFDLAFGIDEGLNDTATDRTQLRRTMVQPGDTALDFLLRTRLGWSPLQRVRARARVRDRARRLATRRGTGHTQPPSAPPSRQR